MGIERDQRLKNYPDIALVAGTLPKQTREPRRVRGQAHRVGAFNGGTATTLTAGERAPSPAPASRWAHRGAAATACGGQ